MFNEMLYILLQLINLLSLDGPDLDGRASDSRCGKEYPLTFCVAPVSSRPYPARMPATIGKEGAVV